MPTGLTSQDIQCIKDELLIGTADLLGVSISHGSAQQWLTGRPKQRLEHFMENSCQKL